MLVVEREVGEKVIIRAGGEVIVVTVAAVDRCYRKVRLGFQAPASIAVNREELDVRKFPEAKGGAA